MIQKIKNIITKAQAKYKIRLGISTSEEKKELSEIIIPLPEKDRFEILKYYDQRKSKCTSLIYQ